MYIGRERHDPHQHLHSHVISTDVAEFVIASGKMSMGKGDSPGNWHAQNHILVFHQLVGIYWIHSSICKKISYSTAIPLPSHDPSLVACSLPSCETSSSSLFLRASFIPQGSGGKATLEKDRMGNKKSQSPQLVIHASEQNAQKGQLAGSRRTAWRRESPTILLSERSNHTPVWAVLPSRLVSGAVDPSHSHGVSPY